MTPPADQSWTGREVLDSRSRPTRTTGPADPAALQAAARDAIRAAARLDPATVLAGLPKTEEYRPLRRLMRALLPAARLYADTHHPHTEDTRG